MPKISFLWTIIFGIIIGTGANLLTPLVRRLLNKISGSFRQRYLQRKETFEKSVEYLLKNPYDEINLGTEKNGLFLKSFLFLTVAILLVFNIDIHEDRIFQIFQISTSIVFVIFGIDDFKKGQKYQKLVLAAWARRKESHPEIDLD